MPASQKTPPFRSFQIGKRISWLKTKTPWPPRPSSSVELRPEAVLAEAAHGRRPARLEAVVEQVEGVVAGHDAGAVALGPDEAPGERQVGEDLPVEPHVVDVGAEEAAGELGRGRPEEPLVRVGQASRARPR